MVCSQCSEAKTASQTSDVRLPSAFMLLAGILISAGINLYPHQVKNGEQGSVYAPGHRLQLISDNTGKMSLRGLEYSEKFKNQGLASIPAQNRPFFFLPIPVNYSDKELLMTIDGIGEVMAARILEEKRALGVISSPDDLAEIEGIGPKKLAKFRGELSFEAQ